MTGIIRFSSTLPGWYCVRYTSPKHSQTHFPSSTLQAIDNLHLQHSKWGTPKGYQGTIFGFIFHFLAELSTTHKSLFDHPPASSFVVAMSSDGIIYHYSPGTEVNLSASFHNFDFSLVEFSFSVLLLSFFKIKWMSNHFRWFSFWPSSWLLGFCDAISYISMLLLKLLWWSSGCPQASVFPNPIWSQSLLSWCYDLFSASVILSICFHTTKDLKMDIDPL